MMKLYTHPYSSNARKVDMVARLLDINIEREFIDLAKGAHKSEAFLAVNPSGAVPAFVDGDFTMSESNAILLYLCEKKPTPLYPTEIHARAKVNQWLFWMSSHWSPAIAALNFENNLKKMFGQGEADPAQVAKHEVTFHRWASVLDANLAKSDWVAGATMTLADIAVAAPLMYTDAAKLPVQTYAYLGAWYSRMRETKEWQATEPKMG